MSDVGVGIVVRVKQGAPEVLLVQKREGLNGDSQWMFPGGKIESGETAKDAIAREVQEETNIVCKPAGEIINKVHSSTTRLLYYVCDYASGEARNMEPDTFSNIRWSTPAMARDLLGVLISPEVRKLLQWLGGTDVKQSSDTSLAQLYITHRLQDSQPTQRRLPQRLPLPS